MKLRKKSIGSTLVETAVGVGGGVVANMLDTKVMPTQSDTIKIAVKAGVGAILPLFIDNSITNSLASSMIGVAGYQLATTFLGDDSSSSTTPATTGFPPAYNAVEGLPSEWIAKHTKATKKASVSGTTEGSNKAVTM